MSHAMSDAIKKKRVLTVSIEIGPGGKEEVSSGVEDLDPSGPYRAKLDGDPNNPEQETASNDVRGAYKDMYNEAPEDDAIEPKTPGLRDQVKQAMKKHLKG